MLAYWVSLSAKQRTRLASMSSTEAKLCSPTTYTRQSDVLLGAEGELQGTQLVSMSSSGTKLCSAPIKYVISLYLSNLLLRALPFIRLGSYIMQ